MANVKQAESHGQRVSMVDSIGVEDNRKRRLFQDKNLAGDNADQGNRESAQTFNADKRPKSESTDLGGDAGPAGGGENRSIVTEPPLSGCVTSVLLAY